MSKTISTDEGRSNLPQAMGFDVMAWVHSQSTALGLPSDRCLWYRRALHSHTTSQPQPSPESGAKELLILHILNEFSADEGTEG